MTEHETKSVLLVGVGGQGTILASKVLSEGLMQSGFDVKMSEIHGMSQRGGSVTTHVRYGSKVYSPIISIGAADVLVAFEKVEALRYLPHLKPNGSIVVNDFEIHPLSVLTGGATYPGGVIDELKTSLSNVITLNAAEEALKLGNQKAQNIVLLGALVKTMHLAEIDWHKVIEGIVPPKMRDLNIAAFDAGMDKAS